MTKKGEKTKSFKSKVDGSTSSYSITEIKNKIAKLEERLKYSNKLVEDYINLSLIHI